MKNFNLFTNLMNLVKKARMDREWIGKGVAALRYAATWLFGETKTYKTPQSATSSIELMNAYTSRQTTSELASAGMSMPSPQVEVVANRGNKPKKVESQKSKVERLGATWLRYAASVLLLLCLGVGNAWGMI